MNTIVEENSIVNIESINRVKFSALKPVQKREPIISCDDGLISTRGNLSVITGQSKSGKSAVAGAIIAGNLTKSNQGVDTLGLKITPNDKGEGVIYINTELSHADFDVFNRNILKRAGLELEPSLFHSYNFLEDGPDAILVKTKLVTEALSTKHKLRLLVIDGVAEYLWNVNSAEDSNALIGQLMNLARQYNMVIILIIHNNPGDEGKARGHLGSHLERKCETMLEIKKKGERSIITQKVLRNSGNFTPLAFTYNHALGYHTFEGSIDLLQQAVTTKRKVEKRDKIHLNLIEIFEKQQSLPYAEFCALIKQKFKVEIDRAKQLVREFKRMSLVEQNETGEYFLIK